VSRNVRYALIIFALIIAWLLSGFFVGNDDLEEKSTTSDLTHVDVLASTAQPYRPSLSFNARTEPFRLVNLRAETSGPLIAADTMKGAEVAEGTVVGRIDVEGRLLRVMEARSLLEQTQLEYKGALDLQSKGLLSDIEIARNKFSVDSAKASLNSTELELARVEIVAPFDGILNERFYEVGDYLQQGQIFAEFLQLDPLKAVFQVSENEVAELDPTTPITLRLGDGRQIEGRLLFRSAKADKENRAFKVEAVFDNPGNLILADLTGRVSISLKPVKAHSVPASVLSLNTAGRLSIKTVNSDYVVNSYPVEIVTDSDDSVWVTGLPDSVDVIVAGYEYVGNGEKVKVSYQRVDAPTDSELTLTNVSD